MTTVSAAYLPEQPRAAVPKPADFGAGAAKSADLAIDGWGDARGYHLEVGREKSGFAWQEAALIRPEGVDDSSWTGYQCLSGDGRFAAVAVLPASAVNRQAARDHGALAYSVDLTSGLVRPLAGGVGLKYFSPGCGTGDEAVFSLDTGVNDQDTQLLRANLATGKIDTAITAPGQVTSAVPTASGIVGAAGPRLLSISGSGKPVVVATANGDVYDLRPAADGGVNFLWTRRGTQDATAAHEHAGTVTELGTGALARLQLFQGRGGHGLLAGAGRTQPGALAAAAVSTADDIGMARGASASSLDGDALLGPSADSQSPYPMVKATRTAKVLSRPPAPSTATATTAWPNYTTALPQTVASSPAGHLVPKADAAGKGGGGAAAAPAATQTPTCAVPPLDPAKQVMQPNPAQVDWAVQMAEQGLLTGSAYTRPAGFDNLGLAAYAPSSDFPLIALSHPSGGASTVPRSVFEAIMAQESNWSQASWHAPAGTAGDPLIASYYGEGGDIRSINYAGADCGYGISQVTDGMHVGDHSLSAHGQIKVAVDYQENIAAGLQILETTWNSLYTDGIIANNGDPKDLENWYFAAWAYNSGIQPNAANGNTTGCTPGPSCTGPDGTWGLGWTNNPANLDYPPNRDPYLQDTYADAAHPASWPYQERVLGWMASPLLRYGSHAYAKPTYHGGSTWVQPAPFTAMCDLADNHCDPNTTNPTNPGASHCMLNDFECWWHQPVTWIPGWATTCATSPYAVSGGSEPANPTKNPPTCSQDTAKVPAGAIIVDDEPSRLNLQGCGAANWSDNGTFSYSYGKNTAGDPIGAIDTHQLGTGLGGRILFSHTEDGTEPALINTGTWTPNLPSLQYYKIKLHLPGLGAEADNVVYTINPGGGVAPWKIRVNQAWNSEQWVTIGTFAMQNGGNVVLTNQSPTVDKTDKDYFDFDVAYDAVAFVPMGGTPGQPIGGPPGIQDAPKGSNPAFIACGCAKRTAGDPVDTGTGYFGDGFTDLSTPGRGAALDFTRSYAEGIADPDGPNKSLAADGPFGWGWTFSYNMSAATDPGTGMVTIKQEDDSQVQFSSSNGTYTTVAPRYDATLSKSGTSYVYTRRGKNIFTFDVATGRLTAETNPAGAKAGPPYQTALGYDGAGHLATITDPANRTYTLTWTGNHITALADQAGRTVTYGYDAADNLTDVVDIAGGRRQYTYTGSHLMTSMRTPGNYGKAASATTSMTYDSSERVQAQTDPTGHTTTFTYGPGGGLTAGQTLVTDPSGHKTLDTYQNSLLVSETKGYGTADAGTWSYTYDPVTLGVNTQTDPDGHFETFSYDDHGNTIAKSDALGATTAYQYDDADNLVETVGPDRVATVNAYDQSGHVPAGATGEGELTSTTVTQANNVVESTTGNFGPEPVRTTNYYYDDAAHPADQTRSTTPLGKTTTTTYDAYGDKTSVTDPANDKTTYAYNTATGWLTVTTDARGMPTTQDHDANGNVVHTTDPLNHVTSASYDADGNKTSITDANNHTTVVAYDADDRPVTTTQDGGTAQTTDYNPDGTIADTVDGLGKKTTFGYDGQGRKNSRTDADTRTTTTHIDPAGRVLTTTDPDGRITTLGYDAAGRTTSVAYSDGHTAGATYGYDPAGRRVSMTDSTGTTTWVYDVFGEQTTQTQGSGATVGYTYDDDGNQTAVAYPGQTGTVTRTYDNADRLRTLTDWAGNATTFGYNADNQVATINYPNGTTVTTGYDNAGRATAITAATGGTTVLAATYTRDPVGQPSTQTVAGTSQSVTYTPREQLATAGSSAFGYDNADNPTTVAGTTQTFDPAGQLLTSGGTGYGSDDLGERTTAGTGTTYGYDQAGRLSTYTSGSIAATYAYDGTGLRVGKTVNGTTGTFTWDDSSTPDVLTDGVNDYLYGPGGLPVEQIGAGGPSWFVHDGLGSTIGLLDSAGAVTGHYSYTPYGIATFTGTTTTPLQFTAQYTDAESHLIYLRARYYDPATALFLTLDPLVDRTGTPYAYAGNNPLVAIDPTGLGFWDIVTDIGEAVVIGAVDVGEEFLTDGAATPFLAEEDSAIAAGFSALRGLIGGYAKAQVLGDTINDLGYDSGGSAAAVGGVYTLRDDDGNVQYVGRTNDFGKRRIAHGSSPTKGGLNFQQEYTSQDYDTVRGLEQYLYDVHSPILNKIRPISLRNGNIGKYLEAACKFIGELG
ncbi:RHS repeat-associated core domain-containing protein [Amycolatopsis sp. NPDC051716]|uniref:RHS repeat-associated core domain-containing protein n=1 Tax=Amycolatopsis sp. NPDC051716 TaxID=3155804 RepID=UPI0034443BCB